MFRKISELPGLGLGALDGGIGTLDDVLFDDEHWAIRYLVVKTGNFLNRKGVLLSPLSVCGYLESEGILEVRLTRGQVQSSPDIDTHAPVTRQQEMNFLSYYGWPVYWGGPGLWASGAYPLAFPGPLSPLAGPRSPEEMAPSPWDDPGVSHRNSREWEFRVESEDSHLHSCRDVRGFTIAALDGEAGTIHDYLFDANWVIRFVLVETGNFWKGKSLLVDTAHLAGIDWRTRSVRLTRSLHEIQSSPPRPHVQTSENFRKGA